MRKCLIFLIAAAFLAVPVMPAMAQDDGSVSISGQAMIETSWYKVDSKANAIIQPGSISGDTDVIWQFITPGTSINFAFKKGDISGEVVLRPFASSNSRMYGAWNFGAGTLTIGNFNTPFNRPQSALHHLGGKAEWAGNLDYVTRNRGLMLTFPLGGGTLQFAAVKQASHSGLLVPAAGEQDAIIPKLEASYNVKFGGFNLWVGGGYQTYDEVVITTNKEYSIDSWGLSIYGSYGFGPITVNGGITTAQNMKEYGFSGPPPFYTDVPLTTAGAAVYDPATDGIKDSELLGWHISAGWKISDMLTLQAGYGTNKWERDPAAGLGETVTAEDKKAFYYINMPIFAAKGLTITPEIGILDEKDAKDPVGGSTTDQGKETYYGVRWFIRF